MANPGFEDYGQSTDGLTRTLFQSVQRALQEHSVEWVIRVVASGLWKARKIAFIRGHAVNESRRLVRLPINLIGQYPDSSEMPGSIKDVHDVCGFDHVSLWNKEGKPYLFLSEPYYTTKKQLKELIAFCDKYDIDFQIDAESMYFPGHAIRILFQKEAVTQHAAMAHQWHLHDRHS